MQIEIKLVLQVLGFEFYLSPSHSNIDERVFRLIV